MRGGDSAAIKNPELVETISHMLHLENSEDLAFALTTLRTMTRGTLVHVHVYTHHGCNIGVGGGL